MTEKENSLFIHTLQLTQSRWALLLLPPRPQVFLLHQWIADQSLHTAQKMFNKRTPIINVKTLFSINCSWKCFRTFPFWTSSLASWTTLRTLEAIQRYLKNLWWADQNWPHIDFFMRCSASIRFAACWNFSRARTHLKRQKGDKDSLTITTVKINIAAILMNSSNNLINSAYQFHWFVVHGDILLT